MLDEQSKYIFAKSFTELAIQNNFFFESEDVTQSAKEVATFFNTIVNQLDKRSPEE